MKRMNLLTVLAIIFIALGGVGAVLLIFGQHQSAEKSTTDIKKSILESTDTLKSKINSIIDKPSASLPEDSTRFEGYSVLLHTKLVKQRGKRRKFILDGGEINKNRISIYLDDTDNLCFRIIDDNSESHTVKLSHRTFDFFNDYNIYHFEAGTSDDYSFLRIVMNGKVEARNKYDYKINFNTGLNLREDIVMGGNIEYDNLGKFYMVEVAIYSETLTKKNLNDIFDYLNGKEIVKTVYFNGSSIMATDKKGNKNNNFGTKGLTPPTLHFEKKDE